VPVHLSLREESKSQENRKKQEKKHKSWKVFLEWEFSEFGAYHTEIKVTGKTLNAKLWIENKHIEQKLRSNFSKLRENLEKNGVEVASLICVENPLASSPKYSHKALIDVRT
jgi:sugar phosphate isomerase/epimerase